MQAEEHWKKEWLRRQRVEHEQSLIRRQRNSTLDVTPVLDASTLLPIGAAWGGEGSQSPLHTRASSTSSLNARAVSPLDDVLSIDDLLHVEAVPSTAVVWQREAYPAGRAYPSQHVRLEQCSSGSPTPPSRRSSRSSSSAANGSTPRQAWQLVDSATLAERAANEADTLRAPSEGAGSEETEQSLAETLCSEAKTVHADDQAPSLQPLRREQSRGWVVEPAGAEPHIAAARLSRISDEAYLAQRARLQPLLDLGGAAATARDGHAASLAIDAEMSGGNDMGEAGDVAEEASGVAPTATRWASDDKTPPSLVTVRVAAREVMYTQELPLSKTMRKLGIGNRRNLSRVVPVAAWGDPT